jgi:hypothetical protein
MGEFHYSRYFSSANVKPDFAARDATVNLRRVEFVPRFTIELGKSP